MQLIETVRFAVVEHVGQAWEVEPENVCEGV